MNVPYYLLGKVKADSLLILGLIHMYHEVGAYGCVISDYKLAQLLGKSKRSIQMYLKELKDNELIQVETIIRDNERRPIRVMAPNYDKIPNLKSKKEAIQKRDKKNKDNGDYQPEWLEDYMKNF